MAHACRLCHVMQQMTLHKSTHARAVNCSGERYVAFSCVTNLVLVLPAWCCPLLATGTRTKTATARSLQRCSRRSTQHVRIDLCSSQPAWQYCLPALATTASTNTQSGRTALTHYFSPSSCTMRVESRKAICRNHSYDSNKAMSACSHPPVQQYRHAAVSLHHLAIKGFCFLFGACSSLSMQQLPCTIHPLG